MSAFSAVREMAEPTDEVLVEEARRILAVDRRYLRMRWDGRDVSLAEAREMLEPALAAQSDQRSPKDHEVIRALYLLAATATRLEQVDMRVDLDWVRAFLGRMLGQYLETLTDAPVASQPDHGLTDRQLVMAIRRARSSCQETFLRVLEIDGETWFRRELVVPVESASRTVNLSWVREQAHAQIDEAGDCLDLITSIMKRAAADERHRADHATLMCPRGTHLDSPQDLTKDDFAIFVVFPDRPATWETNDWERSKPIVRKAMFAHHATKKSKIAKRLYGTGVYRPDPLSDDLGSLGIYYNEDAHHKGHQVAGVSAAMRSVMTLAVRGDPDRPLHSLTDWRLSRNNSTPQGRFRKEQFWTFHHYGLALKQAVEVSHERGLVLPAMLGEWRG